MEPTVIRGSIKQPDGTTKTTYARIPVMLKAEYIAQTYSEKAMLERYGKKKEDYNDVEKEVYDEIYNDFLAGYQLGMKRLEMLQTFNK